MNRNDFQCRFYINSLILLNKTLKRAHFLKNFVDYYANYFKNLIEKEPLSGLTTKNLLHTRPIWIFWTEPPQADGKVPGRPVQNLYLNGTSR